MQSVPKTIAIHLRGAVPPTMDPIARRTHEATGYALPAPSAAPPRLLGVPFSADADACTHAAYARSAGAMHGVAAHWTPRQLGLLGRAHVAQACIASKAVYLSTFLLPSEPHLKNMQAAVNDYVAASERPEEETPYKSKLYPKFQIAALPTSRGGLGLPNLRHSFAAMRAKS